jgi:hypothetical protein
VPSKIDVVGLEYVTEVAEAGSFAGAARRLGLNSSTLTRRVSKVEDRLGITLFERTRAGFRITRSGRDAMGVPPDIRPSGDRNRTPTNRTWGPFRNPLFCMAAIPVRLNVL